MKYTAAQRKLINDYMVKGTVHELIAGRDLDDLAPAERLSVATQRVMDKIVAGLLEKNRHEAQPFPDPVAPGAVEVRRPVRPAYGAGGPIVPTGDPGPSVPGPGQAIDADV